VAFPACRENWQNLVVTDVLAVASTLHNRVLNIGGLSELVKGAPFEAGASKGTGVRIPHPPYNHLFLFVVPIKKLWRMEGFFPKNVYCTKGVYEIINSVALVNSACQNYGKVKRWCQIVLFARTFVESAKAC
jgi:hypothetical protein